MRQIRLRTAPVAAVLAIALVSGCAQGSNPTYRVDGPSFHSAGPGAQDELQSVLDSQAKLIVAGDWAGLLALFIPTERARCRLDNFTEISEESFSDLRKRAGGSRLAAQMSDLELDGFRASVEYQFFLPTSGQATTAQTAHYLKLGDRWFIDEKAC